AREVLPELRRLLFEMRRLELAALEHAGTSEPERQERARALFDEARARQKAAQDLATRAFMSEPLRQKAYQPCGDLRIAFDGHDHAGGYRRWLDLDSAIAVTEYSSGGTAFR